ncbi:MAG: hypothetical protein U0984_08785 [Prosthecobacter sp.]|nr:hypothetical protein [Prosthecobacter sp.]
MILGFGRAVLPAAPAEYFGIHVIDEATGRGVPLISLTTTNRITLVTDSAGWIAFNEPGLMDREVFFTVEGSPGYSFPKDGFGFAGLRLTPKAGASAEIKVKRENIAERLYRVTGQGIYRDSTLLGKGTPLPRPNLNADVMGQDSVQVVPYRGRLFWLWGDTPRPNYPLGNFHCTCAWSDLPGKGGLDPAEGVSLDYITNEQGQVRKMAPTEAPGVVWVFGVLTVTDAGKKEHLLGHYGRFKDLGTCLEHGFAEYDDELGRFLLRPQEDKELGWQHPEGNAVRVTEEKGDYFYFSNAFPVARVPANYESLQDPKAYEALAWSEDQKDYVWQKEKPPVTQASEALAVAAMPAGKARFQVKDAATGDRVSIHHSSVNWNAYRKCWIMIAVQHMSKISLLGEVWYAEAASPIGPWTKAVKIATHPRYSFYNPRHHPFFDQQGGRLIYFEGTYTETFSGNPVPTPRYDYNQIMYRLDLDDPRLEAAR